MKVEKIDGSFAMTIDEESYRKAPKLFAQNSFTIRGEREMGIAIGQLMPPFSQGQVENVFETQVVCYFTIPHFKDFVKALVEQVDFLDKSGTK